MAKAKKRNQIVRAKYIKLVGNYLATHPCVDCGETDVQVLEFDHKDHAKKTTEVSTLRRSMPSVDKLIAEIEKCEVRCANCHRRKTNKENNSWKLNYAPVA